MLHTCTDKMADRILLPVFAGNFAVFVVKQHFLYLFGKKLVQRRAGEMHDTVFLPASDWSLVIIDWHHMASFVMPIGDPPDRFFYPILTLMMDSYIACLISCLN